jgi:uncharacterized cofD-like protein
MKKIVIFGGGSGLSQILKGLKLFPIDITAVVSVFDNGRSTGRLRKEMHQPAVGDITKVMLSMANVSEDMTKLMNYRFTKSKTLGNHSIKNLLLTALLDIKGDFDTSLPILEDILDIENGKILPLTEDSVNLVGITNTGKEIIGEEQITKSKSKIIKIKYDKDITVNPKVINAVRDADLIIFSSGSLFTSIIPHLIDKKLVSEIKKSKADKMYLCNLFTQPGETDNLKVSDHIKILESYLGKNTINLVVANNKPMSSKLAEKYSTDEQKDPVILDAEVLNKMGVYVISDHLYTIEDGYYRHDSLKTSYLIFSYLMEGRK